MSKVIKKAFHPGSYLKEYLEELEMTQDEFAKRLGISGKHISLILSEDANITADIAYKLSKLIGTSAEMWLNLQTKYDTYIAEVKANLLYDEEIKIFKMIDKNFLKQMKIIDENDNIDDAIEKLRTNILVSSLMLLVQNDIYSFCRTSVEKELTIENVVCRNVWISVATQIARKQETKPFNEKKILENIKVFRKMTLSNPDIFYPQLKQILSDCGISLVVLPSLKNSNINGVVKWLGSEKVMMALNTRGAYNDKFWFSFFHELKHVLQKTKRKMTVGEDNVIPSSEEKLEIEADEFAKETLIPSKELEKLNKYTEYYITLFAETIGIHPGIVVGRLQKENKIKYSYLNNLKEKYKIAV